MKEYEVLITNRRPYNSHNRLAGYQTCVSSFRDNLREKVCKKTENCPFR